MCKCGESEGCGDEEEDRAAHGGCGEWMWKWEMSMSELEGRGRGS